MKDGCSRKDFPLFTRTVNGYPLIYLDNAATTQKPDQVIDAMMNFYRTEYASVHRGVYDLAEVATQRYEGARARVAQFINADSDELIFTSGATHGINLIAHAWGMAHLSPGDEVVLTEREHHSLLLAWQHIAAQRNAVIKYIPVDRNGLLDFSMLSSIISSRTKLVAASTVSNVTGEHIDCATLIRAAHAVGARVLLDAAQSIGHEKTDVKALDVDFLVFSGHKMLGPSGIGGLYIKRSLQDEVPPFHFGGGMVYEAGYEQAQWRTGPHKFEAGTPPIAQAIGLGAAVDYIATKIDFEQLRKHEAALCARLIAGLEHIPSISILGSLKELQTRGHLVSFVIHDIHAHDVAAYLAARGICVRAGHLCAQPLAKKLGIESALRMSFYCYNTIEEVDFALESLALLIKQWCG